MVHARVAMHSAARPVKGVFLTESLHDLTSAMASGDTEAFARFYRERFDGVFAEARRASGRDEAFCLDVVQDAMIRMIRTIRPVETEERLRAWLRVVVQSCAYDRLRKEIRRRRWETAAAPVMERQSATDDEVGDRVRWLRGELAAMESADARLLVLRYRLGWTLERIGQLVGLKPGAVDGRLARLVTKLRRRAEETSHD